MKGPKDSGAASAQERFLLFSVRDQPNACPRLHPVSPDPGAAPFGNPERAGMSWPIGNRLPHMHAVARRGDDAPTAQLHIAQGAPGLQDIFLWVGLIGEPSGSTALHEGTAEPVRNPPLEAVACGL